MIMNKAALRMVKVLHFSACARELRNFVLWLHLGRSSSEGLMQLHLTPKWVIYFGKAEVLLYARTVFMWMAQGFLPQLLSSC